MRRLEEEDAHGFFDLMGNPKVMDPIPQQVLRKEESDLQLTELIILERSSSTKILCLCRKGSNDLIGICGVLKNDEGEDEIAYRIIEEYWGKGYGTEITVGLINYCFVNLQSTLVTADVCIDNTRSVRILEKCFTIKKEFFNAADNCIDRRYILKREDWVHHQIGKSPIQ